jgi:hypothetical protein
MKRTILKATFVILAGCSDEKPEERCYQAGGLRQITSASERFPELPCVTQENAKVFLDRGCERLDVEGGPEEKRETTRTLCCYDVTYKKFENCVK